MKNGEIPWYMREALLKRGGNRTQSVRSNRAGHRSIRCGGCGKVNVPTQMVGRGLTNIAIVRLFCPLWNAYKRASGWHDYKIIADH